MATPFTTGTVSQQDQTAVPHTRSDYERGVGRGRGIRGTRGHRGSRGSRGITASSQSRTTNTQPSANHLGRQALPATLAAPVSLPTVTTPATAKKDDTIEAEICFICASDVVYQCLTPCNHRTCHICGLRMRALYKNNDCAHCRVCIMLIR